MKQLIVPLMLMATLGLTRPAHAGPDDEEQGESSGPLRQASLFTSASAKAPWRGSQLVLRNALSAITLDPGAEQTYNPYYAMTYSIRPWWWFGDKLYARARLDVVHELTEADSTTESGEALLDDLTLTVGGANLYTIPWVDISISADLVITTPTSKASQARTMVLALGPGLRLSRAFPVLGGLAVGYNLRVTPRFHRYTTAQRETPLIPGCSESGGGCDAYLGAGPRNPALRLVHVADASLRILDWLGVYLAAGQAIDWLYELDDDDRVTFQALPDEDQKFLTYLELGVSFRPLDLLEVALGYSALHPQLSPGSSYYVPFFNRYSVFYVDLKLHVDGLVSRMRRILQ